MRLLLLARQGSEIASDATVCIVKVVVGSQVVLPLVLFQQLQIFGNHQYLIQDVVITLLVCLTSKQLREASCVFESLSVNS